MKPIDEQLPRLLRGTTQVVSLEELKAKLAQGRPLTVKMGVDPTAPDIHLGHTVVLNKLRVFQEFGHHVVFLIGDFTAAIGDPTGRDATRPPLSDEAVQANLKSYTEQVFKILDRDQTKIVFNGDWLYPLFDRNNPNFIIKTLLRQHTVQQLMEREDFTARRKKGEPISLLELLYPLFQGYDSVAIRADVELGGNDQLFNLLMGRTLQRNAGQEAQVVLTLPLLEGLDGARKMSKSYGNHVGVTEPPESLFGKLMSVPDELMWKYFELLSDEDVAAMKRLHPMEAKKRLAGLITGRFHGDAAARAAREGFERVFSKGDVPENLEELPIPAGALDVVELLVRGKLAPSKNEARRLVEQGGVQLDGRKLALGEKISVAAPAVLKVGKRRFARLVPLLPPSL